MSTGRYILLKMAIGFVMFVLFVFPAFFLAGALAWLLPKPIQSLGIVAAGIIWLFGMTLGTHFVTEKLSKRWSR